MPDAAIVRLLALALVLAPGAWSSAAEIDTRPLTVSIETALAGVTWTGWQSPTAEGVVVPLRPMLVTHAGDQSGRRFIPTQQGVVHVLPAGAETGPTGLFLDIQSLVAYDDKTNEEGLLGLAFHPRYAQTGELFVYYTNRQVPHQNIVARYRASADDPQRADPGSAEILLVIDKPFWNHDGGTLAFGPDGYLYIAIGDGGARNDPFAKGQNLSTWLGKILRIDVDHRDTDRPYAIPADNPFRDDPTAKPEIWALGLRNVWRMAFDRTTGQLWAADVGQDTWEEINLVARGGNYGWNLREGLHPFGPHGAPPRPDLMEPIWEYHHDLGKSITGGVVYRGRQVPELAGAYLYADYVSGRLWALWYDASSKTVTANREIPLPRSLPVLSFGEDEAGEVYLTTVAADGQGIFRLAPAR